MRFDGSSFEKVLTFPTYEQCGVSLVMNSDNNDEMFLLQGNYGTNDGSSYSSIIRKINTLGLLDSYQSLWISGAYTATFLKVNHTRGFLVVNSKFNGGYAKIYKISLP